jgi:N-methylhydantoinase A/oxoprolinase/acetone carboxylase beta subunit
MEGARALAEAYGLDPLLTMDVGGTTTDVGIVRAAAIGERRHGEVEGVETSLPLAEVSSIEAGGGSVFRVRDGAITVGPDSVGALPGPACFGRGGKEATFTDAALLLGVLDAKSYFGGALPLDAERARAAIETKIAAPLRLPLEQALLAMEEALVAKVAAACAALGRVAGKSAALAAFGGGGPMTACRVSEKLGVGRVIVPGLAAVFSAWGIGFSDVAHRYERRLRVVTEEELRAIVTELEVRGERDMFAEGFDLGECRFEVSLSAGAERFPIDRVSPALPAVLPPGEEIVASLRVVRPLPRARVRTADGTARRDAVASGARRVLLRSGEWERVPVYPVAEQPAGARAAGPLVLEDPFFSALVPGDWTIELTANRDVVLERP